MQPSRHPMSNRWTVVGVFFVFMLLHQTDRLLIGPLTPDIQKELGLTLTQVGAFSTGALIVGAILYPIWGYLYDRFSRAKLLAAAAFIWGSTTWMNGIAANYPTFLVTRSATGIDDSSYPGLYSLIADYFSPSLRGKIYGILQLTQPIGYLLGMVLALLLGGVIGWRKVFFLTGSLGILLAIIIFFTVREAPRGQSEPELAELEEIGVYRFEWNKVGEIFKKRSLWLVFLQGFFGVFPWNVITFFFFLYLTNERHYSDETNLVIMGTAVIAMAAGYPLGGALGDWAFKRTHSGRAIVGATGVIIGAILLWFTLQVPNENIPLFMGLLTGTALTMPLASPNVIAIVYDVTLPEIRSTAYAIESFIESAGAAMAPLMTGIIADNSSIRDAMLMICVSTWILCFVFFVVAAFLIPKDVDILHTQLQERAAAEKARLVIV
jgi:MFS family permease